MIVEGSEAKIGEMSDRGPKREQEYLGEGYDGGTKGKWFSWNVTSREV